MQWSSSGAFLLHLLPRSCYPRGPRLPASSTLKRRCAPPVGSDIFTVIESHAVKRLHLAALAAQTPTVVDTSSKNHVR